ncbi:hypothetical protein RB195_014921 [Necator americanus]|uniref:7TM GPCR serpentine receptor class x (Srx) domain-containing protein n=1 Tax=Necator americanus TaxID=51031 RepID=A0ABR1E284_NECAM
MVVGYTVIVISVYRNRRIHGAIQQRQSLLDARLAFQFIVICLSQYLAALLFYIVPKMSAGADWGVLVTNSIVMEQQTSQKSLPSVSTLLFRDILWSGNGRSGCDAELQLGKLSGFTPEKVELIVLHIHIHKYNKRVSESDRATFVELAIAISIAIILGRWVGSQNIFNVTVTQMTKFNKRVSESDRATSVESANPL